ncbi:Cystathionine gamma-lyase [Lonchura striata]|uniref:Cystathionine gamma-lyase n=1 Tax=Lonchura striata TaxID=40157 RepID=A0A218UJD6_9PASE|nr:Cystathionine gamma-lyase [Lonchura striata domestica]
MADTGTQGFLPPFKHFATDAIHFGQKPEQWSSWAVVPPISLSTTFKQQAPGEHTGYEYIRSGNPTRECLEKAMAALDGAKYCEHLMGWTGLGAAWDRGRCLAYSSGSAALLNICHLVKPGDTVISMDDVYGGGYSIQCTRELFDKLEKDYNIKVRYVDCTDLKLLEAAIASDTKIFVFVQLVWLESPTNPTLKVIDIKACADVAHKYKDVLVAVDNSLMSPYFQVCGKRTGLSPVPVGLEIPVGKGSAAKELQFWSLHGHCDVLMGLVSVNRDDLYESLKHLQSRLGAVPSPFDCFLCNRGLKTLHIRMKLHFKNGLAVAKFLESHPRVEKVLYPGLPFHPQHEVMKKQCTGFSGMVSFYIKGTIDNAFAFLGNLKVQIFKYPLLVNHLAIMTHASVPEEVREKLGITDTLIRLSVGLEDEEDLLADLDQALKAAVICINPEGQEGTWNWTWLWTRTRKPNHSCFAFGNCSLGSRALPCWAQPGLSLPMSGARSWVGAAVGTPGMCSQFSQQSSVSLLLLQGLGTGLLLLLLSDDSPLTRQLSSKTRLSSDLF